MSRRPRSAVLVLFATLACPVAGATPPLRSASGPSVPFGLDCAPPMFPFQAAQGRASPEPPAPLVVVHVRVPASVGVGQELTYRITVENQSRAAAHHVLLRNPLPAHARFVRAEPEPTARDPELLWQFGTLAGGARKEVTLVLAAEGTGDIKNCARVQFEHGQCVTTKVAKPGISLRKTGPTQALLYDHLTFQLTVTNTGPTELTNVVVTERLSPGLEHALGGGLKWVVGTLVPGQAQVLDYQAIAKQAGRLSAKAAVTANGGLRDEAESTVTVTEPKLAVRITGEANRLVNAGTPYQITVTNAGQAPLANVRVTLPVPAQLAVAAATPGARAARGEVQWLLGPLAPGASRAVDVVLRAQAAGEYRLQANATADRGLKASDAVTTTFTGVPALTLDLVVSDDPVEVGRETRYRVTVRNPGTQPVTQVRVVATLPEQLTVVKASGPADHRKDGPKIVFEPLTIQPKQEVRYEVLARAVKPGDVRVRVDLTAEQLTAGAVTQVVSTTIYQDVP